MIEILIYSDDEMFEIKIMIKWIRLCEKALSWLNNDEFDIMMKDRFHHISLESGNVQNKEIYR